MTIVIAGWIKVAEDQRDRLLLSARPYIEAALGEPGCEFYSWAADLSEPGVIHVFERWRDEASLRAHFSAESYLKTLQLFTDSGEFESDVNKYRVDLFEPVYDDKGVPRADFFSAA